MNVFNLKKEQISNKGITLIALVITIIVLLILAGISIGMLTGENGILTKADVARNITERADIIERARVKILEKQTENSGTLTEQELTDILTPAYGTLSNNEETTVLDKILTTTDNKYQIPVKEIWNGEFSPQEVEMISFTLGRTYSYKVKKGTTLREFLREHANDVVGENKYDVWWHFNKYQEDWPDDTTFEMGDVTSSYYFGDSEGNVCKLGDEIKEGNYDWY